ncbi:MAG: TetR/AcrR family transcriptional regulator [Mesorhizobium sp.]
MARVGKETDSRTAILDAAEDLFSRRGYGAVALREIARAAGLNVGSLTYHFGDKAGILAAIYERHTRPMNARRLELIREATRIEDRCARLTAILRAYVVPAFRSSGDLVGGGARFTRLRAMLSAEGSEQAREIIADAFDATTHAFIDAIADCVPGSMREDIVWRSQFLLGSLYYTLINPERISRLSDGKADGFDHDEAIRQIVEASHASLWALARPRPSDPVGQKPERAAAGPKTIVPSVA